MFRLPQLDTDFQALLRKEKNWPIPLPYMKNIYSDFLHSTNTLVHNIVCASCDIIGHDFALFHNILTNDQSLRVLSVSSDIYVPYDFRSGIPELDNRRVLIGKLGIPEDDRLSLCESCYKSITVHRRPHESLSNYRWIGEQPKKLQGLTWVEELLIARAHLVGRIMRLEERKASSYFALRDHTILLPQDMTRLLNLLPMFLSSLSDVVRVVWAGKLSPEKSTAVLTVRRQKIYEALHWLCQHHEDYRQVRIDEERLTAWNSTEAAMELLDSMSHC